ncbi:MAG: prepilin-type N-terminal cleavage/methylation domain-containing protein [Flavobacteriaceae bacterium]|jgi:prepilin-type N-terminal cleavage/methylation domain-containing protein
MKFYKKNNTKGFTLLETIVALFIMSTAMSALVFITLEGVNNTTFVKDRLTANFLAQEGVELVRNIRDVHVRFVSAGQDRGASWNTFTTFMNPCIMTDCTIDPIKSSIDSNIVKACKGTCPFLTMDSAEYVYSYGSGDDTKFKRFIRIYEAQQGQLFVISRVEWSHGTKNQKADASVLLTDWLPSL